MMHMIRSFAVKPRQRLLTAMLMLAAALLTALAATPSRARSGDETRVTVYLFWQQGCPYCAAATEELEAQLAEQPLARLERIEIGRNDRDDARFARALNRFGHEQAAVPLVVIGNKSFMGFTASGASAKRYREAIRACTLEPCPDIFASAETGTAVADPPAAGPSSVLPEAIRVPFLGDVRTKDLSLSALTVLMAAIDGFNPCAMWVLVFLIGLLLGVGDRRRMWILGLAFLGATALMYFLVMAAWLNLVLFLGAVIWVRIAIGGLAIGGGLFFLREFWTKPEAVCHVASPGRRTRIMNAIRRVVERDSLAFGVLGIMAVAVLVNFVELVCSVGVPAVYTQVLALSGVSPLAYYGYLALYILVFLIDDIAIFATAMFAAQVAGLTGRYTRFSHLVGGVVLLVIGAILILRPDLLAL